MPRLAEVSVLAFDDFTVGSRLETIASEASLTRNIRPTHARSDSVWCPQ